MLGLDIAHMCTKFAYLSFSRFGDMIGGFDAHHNLNGSRDLTTPLS